MESGIRPFSVDTDELTNLIDKFYENQDTVLCDLRTLFDDIKIIKKKSASNSIQAFALINTEKFDLLSENIRKNLIKKSIKEVFIKIHFYHNTRNELRIESTIYSIIREQILNMKRSPNFVRCILTASCDDFNNIIDYVPGLTKKEIDDIFFKGGYEEKMLLTITEKIKGSSLRQTMDDKNISYRDFISIYTQILYSLHEMYLCGIRHNDLHPWNILIEVLDYPVEMVFFIDDEKYIIIKTRYIPRIFDFDRSVFIESHVKNYATKYACRQYGECDVDDEKYDISKVMLYAYKLWGVGYKSKDGSLTSDKIKAFCKSIMPNIDKLKVGVDKITEYSVCNVIPYYNGDKCDGKKIPNSVEVRNFKAMMKHSTYHTIRSLAEGYPKHLLPCQDIPEIDYLPVDAFTYPYFFVSSECKSDPIDFIYKTLYATNVIHNSDDYDIPHPSSPDVNSSLSENHTNPTLPFSHTPATFIL